MPLVAPLRKLRHGSRVSRAGVGVTDVRREELDEPPSSSLTGGGEHGRDSMKDVRQLTGNRNFGDIAHAAREDESRLGGQTIKDIMVYIRWCPGSDLQSRSPHNILRVTATSLPV